MGEKAANDTVNAGWSYLRDRVGRIDLRTVALIVMTAGTLILAVLFLQAMLTQPFEPNDDLIWFTKLRSQSFLDLPLSPAWILESPFYRPAAEIFLKALYSLFGMDLTAYRLAQFGCFVLLIGFSLVVVRRLNLGWENALLVTVFAMGSPFIFGSVIWISELPHVIVLICFAASLAVILSGRSNSAKLYLCGVAFSVAVLSKENGLALALFYFYFVRSAPVKATVLFGGIVAAYFALRLAVLGPSMGAAGVNDSVGYFFEYLSSDQRQHLFAGNSIYWLYAYDILAQIAALFFRATQWGLIFDKLQYVIILQSISTALIVAGLTALIKRRHGNSVFIFIVAGTVLGGTLFSYSYARDRHLALPALAYVFLLIISIGEIGHLLRSRALATGVLFCVWLGWSAQAYWTIIAIPGSALEVVEKSYRPFPENPNHRVAPDIWEAARQQALNLEKRLTP
jgi:hypothetical protein